MNKKSLSYPYILWMTGFTIIPLLLIFYYGLTSRSGGFTLDNVKAITSTECIQALVRSLKLSLISTGICLVLAYPLAMILKNFKNSSSIIVFLFILPMWMNFLLRTMAWQVLLDKNGLINSLLGAVGLPGINIINTTSAIVFGMVYNFLPFMVLPMYNVLSKIGDDTIEAAHDLGANAFQTFIKIILPLSIPGIVSGITMVFVPALTTFVISDILGGGMVLLIGNVIEQQFTFANNWNLGSGLSLVLMVFIIFSMVMIAIFDKDGEGTAI